MPTLLSSITHDPTIWERALADGRPINLERRREAEKQRGAEQGGIGAGEQGSRGAGEQGREAEGVEGLKS